MKDRSSPTLPPDDRPRPKTDLPGQMDRSPYFSALYRGDNCLRLPHTRMSQSRWSAGIGSTPDGYDPEDEFAWEEE